MTPNLEDDYPSNLGTRLQFELATSQPAPSQPITSQHNKQPTVCQDPSAQHSNTIGSNQQLQQIGKSTNQKELYRIPGGNLAAQALPILSGEKTIGQAGTVVVSSSSTASKNQSLHGSGKIITLKKQQNNQFSDIQQNQQVQFDLPKKASQSFSMSQQEIELSEQLYNEGIIAPTAANASMMLQMPKQISTFDKIIKDSANGANSMVSGAKMNTIKSSSR